MLERCDAAQSAQRSPTAASSAKRRLQPLRSNKRLFDDVGTLRRGAARAARAAVTHGCGLREALVANNERARNVGVG